MQQIDDDFFTQKKLNKKVKQKRRRVIIQALIQPRIGMNVGQKHVVKMHSEIFFAQSASDDVANTKN